MSGYEDGGRRLVNTHDQLVAAGGGVALTWHGRQHRSPISARWLVYKVNAAGSRLVTDKDAHWSDLGSKSFPDYGGKQQALADAKAWCAKHGLYSGEWKRNRMGDYVPADINARFPLPKDLRP